MGCAVAKAAAIPDVPPGLPLGQAQFLSAVKERLEYLSGQRGTTVEGAVSLILPRSSVNGNRLVDRSVSPLKLDTTAALVLTGVILEYGAATAPSGYLLCNGAAVSRTTFSALFKVIGTSYGVGDGTTTFNVPTSATKIIKT